MTADPTSDDALIPLDRWVISLADTADPPPPPAPHATPDPTPELLRFPLDADMPGEGFQPQLLRFGKAG